MDHLKQTQVIWGVDGGCYKSYEIHYEIHYEPLKIPFNLQQILFPEKNIHPPSPKKITWVSDGWYAHGPGCGF